VAQHLARPIRFLAQSGQIEVRVAQQRVLRERIAIRRDRLVFALDSSNPGRCRTRSRQ
jgi:hypothetical protein